MVDKIALSVADIGSFSVLVFLFLFTFTLLGVELYANTVKVDSTGTVDPNAALSPRPNFDNIMQSFICIFYIMIGDNWDSYAQPYIIGTNQGAGWFFTTIFIIGKTILLNLFLAILLENFEEMDTQEGGNSEDVETEDSDLTQASPSKAPPSRKRIEYSFMSIFRHWCK